jgi:hypothetical protein
VKPAHGGAGPGVREESSASARDASVEKQTFQALRAHDIGSDNSNNFAHMPTESILAELLPPDDFSGISARVFVREVLDLAVEFGSDVRMGPTEVHDDEPLPVSELDLLLRASKT